MVWAFFSEELLITAGTCVSSFQELTLSRSLVSSSEIHKIKTVDCKTFLGLTSKEIIFLKVQIEVVLH